MQLPVIYALALLQLVITLGWMAYANFQASLLDHFGFASLAGLLSVYLGVSGATLAPLIGVVGDRIARGGGRRVLLVVVGGVLAGLAFVGVASTAATRSDSAFGAVIVPLVLVWIFAMTVLNAPALALVPDAAGGDRGPLAVVPVVVGTILPTALWPLVRRGLDWLGGPVTFVLGGVLVVLVAFLVRRTVASHERRSPDVVPAAPGRLGGGHLVLVFVVGVLSACMIRLAGEGVPAILAARLGSAEIGRSLLAAATLGVGTMLAPVLAPLGVSLGTRRGLLYSVVVALACVLGALFGPSVVAAAPVTLLLGGALALHLDCGLPFSLASMPDGRVGLGAGLYLGGAMAGSQLAGAVTWVPSLS